MAAKNGQNQAVSSIDSGSANRAFNPPTVPWKSVPVRVHSLPIPGLHLISPVNQVIDILFQFVRNSQPVQFLPDQLAVIDQNLHLIGFDAQTRKKTAQTATSSASASGVSTPIRSMFHWKNSRVRPRCGRS
jgi:hypothetical protein